MDADIDLPSADRLPLFTLDEARQVVELLLHFEDDSGEGRAAGQLAAGLARRFPCD
ncbi:hypothetical protein [Streptomyces sp. NPDC058757]|uniref:hypothetical protein n=1 Tax=Streptomyces sp. NPDC058757 TaxID=3346626 RepID=UPI0036920D6D